MSARPIQKRTRSTDAKSKRSRVVASLVAELTVDGLATLMGTSRRSVERWLRGDVVPEGIAGAFLGLLARLHYVDLVGLAQGRFHVRVQDRTGYVERVSLDDLVEAWLAQDGPAVAGDDVVGGQARQA